MTESNVGDISDGGAGWAPDRQIADMVGVSALPRKNGELVFAEAWQGRLFGLTVAMNHLNRFQWREFQKQLIDEIAHAESHGESTGYYERWLEAFERLLTDSALVSTEELEHRKTEFVRGERDDAF